MKNNSTLLTNFWGRQLAAAETLSDLRGNLRQMVTDSVLENVELPAAWSVDVPDTIDEGFLSTYCILTAASGIRMVFGHGGIDAPFWSLGLFFNAGTSIALLFVSEVIDHTAIAAIEREIQRVDEYIHTGYNTADKLAAALRFVGAAV